MVDKSEEKKDDDAQRLTKFIHLPKSYTGEHIKVNDNKTVNDVVNNEGASHNSHDELIASEGIASAIPVLVQAKRETELKLLLNDAKNVCELKKHSWDIVPVLCTLINAEQNPVVLYLCDITLEKLVSLGNPKELLLELLSQTDAFIDEVKLNALLIPIQQCILQLPKKRGHSLALTLETIYIHVERMDLPNVEDVSKLEGKELILLHSSERVIRSIDMCEVMMNFLKPFVDDLEVKGKVEKSRSKHDKDILECIVFLLKILSKPLVHFDLNVYNHGVFNKMEEQHSTHNTNHFYYSDIRMTGERAVKIISSLQNNYIALFKRIELRNFRINRQKEKSKKKHADDLRDCDLDDLSDIVVEEFVPELGLACLAYLTFGEGVAMNNFPQVYVPQYHLEMNLYHVQLLLKSTELFVQQKGTLLMLGVLHTIEANTLSARCLDSGRLVPVIDLIVDLVIRSQAKELQQSTLSIIPALLKVFVFKARIRLLSYIINTFQHPGLSGYAISLLKDQIHFCLQSHEHDFSSKSILPLLQVIFVPQKVERDLLDHGDTILGALNLLRYLIMRDVETENITGIWQIIGHIQKHYLDILRRSLDMSRAHYQLDLSKMLADSNSNINPTEPMAIHVGSEPIAMPNMEEKIQILRNALNRFDLIDSLLGRVNDLIAQKK